MKKCALAFLATSLAALAQKKEELEPIQVQDFKTPSAKETLSAFDQGRLSGSSKLHLDHVLLENATFGTFRRSGSGIAHPTSQGVSLRGTGTSAASRSIILLDGIPLNDPFGGWVRWNRFSPGELESVRFGQASAFASSAGTINLNSRRPNNKPIRELRLATGEVHGFSADGFASTAAKKEGWDATTSFRVEDFTGHPVVRSAQRGRVDEDAWSRMQAARASISRQLDLGRLTVRLAGFDDRRGNGTPLARNQGDGYDWSLEIENENTRTVLFGQERDFSSVFPKVAVGRASESIALDQYMVPAKSLGLAHQRAWENEGREFTFSMIAISREGHTHEENKFSGAFRKAGGRQAQVGASITSSWQPLESWFLTTRLSGDWFRDYHGMRSGWTPTDESFPSREKIAAGGSLEMAKELSENLDARATVGSHVRQPTLNELYRPYRVGDFSVDANENLVIERLTKLELGLDWQASDRLFVSFSLFRDHLRDSVANVSSPADPNDAQRINLDRARTQGIEIALDWQFADDLSLRLSSLLLDTEVTSCPENPGIVGSRFAQAPEHRSTATFSWAPSPWQFRLDARHESNRHDDARNSRLLEDSLTLDLSLARAVSDNARLHLSIHNLANEETQTGLSSDAIISTGAPRNLVLGLEWEF